jgi:hypothetical protein
VGERNVNVVFDVDLERFEALFVDSFQRPGYRR